MEEQNKAMSFFPTDKEFVVELRFTKPNEDSAQRLLAALYHGELLPDVVVERIHCQAHSAAQIGTEALLDGVTDAFLDFKARIDALCKDDWNRRLDTNGEDPAQSIKSIGRR